MVDSLEMALQLIADGAKTLDCRIKIDEKGTKLLADALKINTTLTQLNLGGNIIGDKGAKYIATALETNETLTQLDLTLNNIGVDGAKAIAKVLATNKTLTQLDLRFNDIDDAGGEAILKALKTNTTLTSLLLSQANSINYILRNEINQIINRNKAWLPVRDALTALAQAKDATSLVESLSEVFDTMSVFTQSYSKEQCKDLRFPFSCTTEQRALLPSMINNSIRGVKFLPTLETKIAETTETKIAKTTIMCFIDITQLDVTSFGDLIPPDLLPDLTRADLSALRVLAKKHGLHIQAEIGDHMRTVMASRSVSRSSMVNFSFNTLASSSTPATGSSSASPSTKKTKWAQPI